MRAEREKERKIGGRGEGGRVSPGETERGRSPRRQPVTHTSRCTCRYRRELLYAESLRKLFHAPFVTAASRYETTRYPVCALDRKQDACVHVCVCMNACTFAHIMICKMYITPTRCWRWSRRSGCPAVGQTPRQQPPLYRCMYVCMYVCICVYVFMYVCMYVCIARCHK